jgi:hypothetical protein
MSYAPDCGRPVGSASLSSTDFDDSEEVRTVRGLVIGVIVFLLTGSVFWALVSGCTLG